MAIKVLRPELAAALGVERFLAEIKITAALNHPHILPLHDSGQDGTCLYYVMPYVEGESLRSGSTREKQLPLDEALRIAREVADALQYAHGRGVIHRDIKPENILLEGGHALLADFGIARAVSAAVKDNEKLTQIGMAVGTPAYMSPEQAAGDPDVDGRSDLYSLAVVLYEMLVGEPPFTGATPRGHPGVQRFTQTPPHATSQAAVACRCTSTARWSRPSPAHPATASPPWSGSPRPSRRASEGSALAERQVGGGAAVHRA